MSDCTLAEYCTIYNRPELLQEWDKEKNGIFTADTERPHSRKRVCWSCKNGHRWTASIRSRIDGRTGCPVCAGKAVQSGENDLATLYPDLAAQWHPTKNGQLLPNMVRPTAHRKVWWRDEKGHEWLAEVRSRTAGTGCPYCSGRAVLPGETDLATLYPHLALEWHPGKNGALTPQDVRPSTAKKIWWRCERGHEWLATVVSRVKGCGCPICANKKVLPGFNDLQTKYPEIAKQWDSEKNGITPDKIMPTNQKVWWRCPNGHEYQSQISSRIYHHTGCPICAGRSVVTGENDLATLYPHLAKEWHPTKNGPLKPTMVSASSNKKVWWQDGLGHEWEAMVASRTTRGTGCPVCAGKLVLVGYNDLASQEPKIAAQWHPILNAPRTPEMYTCGSNQKIWWQCGEGHVWQAPIIRRCYNRTDCPVCCGTVSKKKLAKYERMMKEALAEQERKKRL